MNTNPADSSSAIPPILILSPAVSSQGCQGKCLMQLHGGTLQNPSLGTSLHQQALPQWSTATSNGKGTDSWLKRTRRLLSCGVFFFPERRTSTRSHLKKEQAVLSLKEPHIFTE